MKFNEYEACVSVGAERMEEFDIRMSDNSDYCIMSCYVPSEAGKTFVVNLTNRTSGEIRMKCYVDGRLVDYSMAAKMATSHIQGVRISPTQILPFLFSYVEMTDDDSKARTPLDSLGTIELHIWRVAILGPSMAVTSPSRRYEVQGIGPIHEKDKTTRGHRVCFAEPRFLYDSCVQAVRLIDPDEKPLVKFIFNYRPREYLLAHESTNSNSAVPEDRHTHPPSASNTGGQFPDDIRLHNNSDLRNHHEPYAVKSEPQDFTPIVTTTQDMGALHNRYHGDYRTRMPELHERYAAHPERSSSHSSFSDTWNLSYAAR